jgi:hypothetical protein
MDVKRSAGRLSSAPGVRPSRSAVGGQGEGQTSWPTIRALTNNKRLQRQLAQRISNVENMGEDSFDEIASPRGDSVRIVTLSDGSVWVFRSDQHPRAHLMALQYWVPRGTRGARERALYLLSRHLRLGVVPKTIRVEWGSETGTLQRHLGPHFGGPQSAKSWESEQAALLLQFMAGVQDPDVGGNRFRVEEQGQDRWKVVDGETAFASEANPRSGADGYYRQWLERLRASGHGTLSSRISKNICRGNLDALEKDLHYTGLSDSEIAVTLARVRLAKERGLEALAYGPTVQPPLLPPGFTSPSA